MLRTNDDGFEGEFTIVNKGSTAISSWELAAVLPGDQIQWVWDATYHTVGDTLTMDSQGDSQAIAPGASLTEYLFARGTTTSPASCTFNGSAC